MRLFLAVRVSLALVLGFTVIPVLAAISTAGSAVATLQPLPVSGEDTVIRVDPGQIEFAANWTCNAVSTCDGNIAHNITDIFLSGTVTFVTASATRGSCTIVTVVRVECDFGTVSSGDDARVTMLAAYSSSAYLFIFDYETSAGFNMDRMMIVDPYQTGTDLIANGGFETAESQKSIPVAWKVTHLAKRKCNQDGKIISFEGECAVQIKGQSGVVSKLIQNVEVPAGIAGEDAFWMEMQLNTKNLTKSPVIIAKWDAGSSGNARAKLSAPLDSGSYTLISRQARFYGAPTGIKVQLVYKGIAGKLYVDQFRFYYVDRSAYF